MRRATWFMALALGAVGWGCGGGAGGEVDVCVAGEAGQGECRVDVPGDITGDITGGDAPDGGSGDADGGADVVDVHVFSGMAEGYFAGGAWVLRNRTLRLTLRQEGVLDIRRDTPSDTTPVVEGAQAWVMWEGVGGGEGEVLRTGGMELVEAWLSELPPSDPLDDAGVILNARFAQKEPGKAGLLWTITLREKGVVTFDVALEGADGKRVQRLSPLSVDGAQQGALWLGNEPLKHVVVDNGSDVYLDFVARAFRVGKGNSLMFPPGNASNWSMGVSGPDRWSGLAAGFLSFEHGVGLVALHHDSATARTEGQRKSFTRFEGFVFYDPPRSGSLGQGVALPSETFYVDFAPHRLVWNVEGEESPYPGTNLWVRHQGLESYAQAFASWHGKEVVTDPPTGWNSWGGGGGSGGLGQGIDETVILQNLEYMVEDFAPVEMDYFLIDDGWQEETGDWNSHPTKFPAHGEQEGMAWVADQIRAEGLIPGIWIAPFWVKRNSKLALQHPDWLADINGYGGLLIKENDATLDLTNPEVMAWLEELFTKITQEWGYQFVKMDFSYFALFAVNLYDKNVTAAEAYHNALRRIREIMGPEGYLVGISATGLFFDVADGGRTTLDNMPWWGDGQKQGIKQTVLTASHRSFLNLLWNSHPDLVFFRDDYGLSWNEAKAFLDFATIQGGIVKLGETYEAFHTHPEWLEAVRHRIPSVRSLAVPQDLYYLKWPERWVGRVERSGSSAAVVGLFNWGLNEYLVNGEALPEESRSVDAFLGDVLESAWNATVIDTNDLSCWRIEEPFVRADLEPRTSGLFLAYESSGGVRLLATNRHWAGGAADLLDETWEELSPETQRYTLRLATPGTAERILVADRDGRVISVVSPADAVMQEACEGVYRIEFGCSGPETEVVLDVQKSSD